MSDATKRPWRSEQGMDDDWWTDVKSGDELVAQFFGLHHRGTPNVQLVLRAVNIFDQAREALKHLTQSTHGYRPDGCSACALADRTLSAMEAP